MVTVRKIAAAVLTLVVTGSGHFLLGSFRRGIVWLAIGTALVLSVPKTMMMGVAGGVLLKIVAAVDALWVKDRRPSWKPVMVGWVGLIIFVVVSGPVVGAYVTRAYTIPSGGMEPALLVGDYLMTDNTAYLFKDPQRGDIVIFKYPIDESRDFIKRIVAIGGDTVQVKDSRAVLNGRPVEEPYVRRGSIPAVSSGHCGYLYGCDSLVVPQGSYFVMGDNRDNSQDSRYFGLVKREKISGRALFVYWSWDSVRHGPRLDRVGQSLRTSRP
jgi:signal peptidase I